MQGRVGGRLLSRLRRIGLVGLAAAGLSACLPPSPPPSIPFAGVPAVADYTGDECLTVLVIGDSMANQLSRGLEDAFASTGRCADVVNRGVSGTAVVDWAPGGSLDPAPVYDEVQPDFVVAHFLGNASTATGLSWENPTWFSQTTRAALAIADTAIERGLHFYWALPPKSAWACDWSQVSAQAFQRFHTWISSALYMSRSVLPLDLRTPFGGETFSRWFQLPDGSVTDLREADCVHFSSTGASAASGLTVAATAGEWGVVTPPPPPEEPTTTTTTAPPEETEPEPTTTTSTSAPEASPEG